MTSSRKPDLTVNLMPSILGWRLIPTCDTENDLQILSDIYGEDYSTMKTANKAFLRGESAEAAFAQFKMVAVERGLSVQACGSKHHPTLRVWKPRATLVQPAEKTSVDLKWGLWAKSHDTWENYAPGLWSRMEEAFLGTTPALSITTAPKKEIRYGTVVISKGQADVEFYAMWDEAHCHVPESLTGSKYDEATNQIHEWFANNHGFFGGDGESPIGAEIGTTVKSRKFANLMNKVSALEIDMREAEAAHSESFERFVSQLQVELVV